MTFQAAAEELLAELRHDNLPPWADDKQIAAVARAVVIAHVRAREGDIAQTICEVRHTHGGPCAWCRRSAAAVVRLLTEDT
jgi:hypothetical protein